MARDGWLSVEAHPGYAEDSDPKAFHNGTNIPLSVGYEIAPPTFDTPHFFVSTVEERPDWRGDFETLLERFIALKCSEPHTTEVRLRQDQLGLGIQSERSTAGESRWPWFEIGQGVQFACGFEQIAPTSRCEFGWALYGVDGREAKNSAGDPLPSRLGMRRSFFGRVSADLISLIRDASDLLTRIPGSIGGKLWTLWPQALSQRSSLWLDFVFEQAWLHRLNIKEKVTRFTELPGPDSIGRIDLVGEKLFPELPRWEGTQFERFIDEVPHQQRYPVTFFSDIGDFVAASISAIELILST